VFLFLINSVSALQDINLTINSKNSGLCLSIDSFDNPYCDNTTLIIEGTNDHIIYIIPESEISYNSTITEKFRYIVFTPLTLLSVVLLLFIMIIFVIGLLRMFVRK